MTARRSNFNHITYRRHRESEHQGEGVANYSGTMRNKPPC
jgi:hypothetical protein